MSRRLLLAVLLFTTVVPMVSLTSSTPSGAATWTHWQATCSKWVLDVAHVDSSIRRDTSTLNLTYLTIDFAGLAIDGKHVRSCGTSPDRVLNSFLVNYGTALYSAGFQCDIWALSKGQRSFTPCYQTLSHEKTIERQVNGRMATLEG